MEPGDFRYLAIKRMVDLFLGGFLLVLSTPIIVIAAVAVRLESAGNPFFLQERIGCHGARFKIIKLRGMYIDSRERFPDLYDYTASGSKSKLDFLFHYENDPRVTKVGSFIRRTSIDELPNFINVVFGDMSLVGPRPEVPEVMELYGKYREKYLSVKPGVTCISKVSGRDHLTKEKTIQMDLDYIDKRSTSLDLKILWHTFLSVVTRKNVFGRGE